MPSILFVTIKSPPSPGGGREMLGRLHRDILRDLYGDRLGVVELEKPVRGTLRSLVEGLRGHIDGLDADTIAMVLRQIGRLGVTTVVLDGSNLGSLAAAIKARAPQVRICTLFHNVEARFFMGALRRSRSARALAVLAINYFAERRSVRHSDTIVTLSARDSAGLERLYGRAATHVSAMALNERREPGRAGDAGKREPYALFVGGTFYANRAGIGWFVKHVAPRIAVQTCVVGHGFEAFRAELERPDKVEVIGGVDSLSHWYRNAQVVVAPIFDGSGMKTKVAEALMFGKKIVGTAEAFSGYEDIAAQAGWVCASADDFVGALAEAQAMDLPAFDPALRAIYDQKYSYAAARTRMAGILGAPVREGVLP